MQVVSTQGPGDWTGGCPGGPGTACLSTHHTGPQGRLSALRAPRGRDQPGPRFPSPSPSAPSPLLLSDFSLS